MYFDFSGAGHGAFSRTFIKPYTWLGAYEGERKDLNESSSIYTWQVSLDGSIENRTKVDGAHSWDSNWLRYVNCPNKLEQLNVKPATCKGQMYYMTSRSIAPGTELFVFYGQKYARRLNISEVEIQRILKDG